MGMGMGMPAEKSLNFGPSLRRLLRRMRGERIGLVLVFLLAVGSVAFAVIGPKILGNATNIIYDGFVGRQLPAGLTKDQVIAGLRAEGNTTYADMLSAMDVVPGQGIDFTALARTRCWSWRCTSCRRCSVTRRATS